MANTQLMAYLPSYYEGIREFQIMMEAEGQALNQLKEALKEFSNQLLLDSATTELERWESDAGIVTQEGASYEDRRALVRSKLRGSGKIDEELIKMVADSWTNGDVEVTFADTIKIKFNGFFGIPKNMDAVKKALDQIIPAHLGVTYDLRYLLVKDIHHKMTIDGLQESKINQFAGGVI